MADLSAVLRKTIDGLPNANPQMRAKVYEKARAAIARQIDAANPPLANDVVEARRGALEDAIDRTEDHYEALAMSGKTAPDQPVAAVAESRPAAKPTSVQKPAWPKAIAPVAVDSPKSAALPERAEEIAAPVSQPTAVQPSRAEEKAPAIQPMGRMATRRYDATEASGNVDEAAIPEADFAAPRYASAQRGKRGTKPQSALLAGLAVVLLAGGAALSYFYLDEIRNLLDVDTEQTVAASPRSPTPVVPVNVAPSALPQPPIEPQAEAATPATPAPDPAQLEVSAAPTSPAVPSAVEPAAPPAPEPATPAPGSAPAATAEEPAGNLDVAALPAPSLPESAPAAPPAAAEPAIPPPVGPDAPPAGGAGSKRQFTQRLLPDGTEVDAGPGPSNVNAFNEGTDVSAASPEPLDGIGAALPTAAAAPEQPALPPSTGPAAGEAPPPAAAPPTATAVAGAAQPEGSAGAVPAVAQKAVFYEERSETEAGTQMGGNVVWSVVNEPPAEGQPSEPAIRAIADVPEENLRLTMTIRRNADATLPASHVIELMFDTPPNFAGGSIANVQRLALKPTEQARGEPLIGVAGKISDGFFIIALNNLTQATDTNLGLLGREQWIDIPLAYATGRRALMSIEKGIPGEKVFKEAMDAWAAKT